MQSKGMSELLEAALLQLDGQSRRLDSLDILQEQNIDLIILDIMMPEMNGYKVLERIKTDEKTKHIPVIVASAFNEDSHKEKALEKGAELYLGKPIDIDLLIEKSEEVLNKISTTSNK